VTRSWGRFLGLLRLSPRLRSASFHG
jgi:hypothetical protein